LYFEGAGDALFCGETLYGGYIIRSDARALQWVAGEMGCRVIPVQLVDPHFYHLDTCFCPLSATEAIWYPAAFDEYGQKAVREHVPELIEVEADEAARFACNAVVVRAEGREQRAEGSDVHVVVNTGCPKLQAMLRERGYTPHATPLDEFIKAGGSAKCLTLRLDGEDAAVWPAKEQVGA
jgi:N-dimethylarginine dimethylaminohydrolase